jgi:hypothetical protein
MNIRKTLNTVRDTTTEQLVKKEAQNEQTKPELVDLGDAKAETHGGMGGATDYPISSGRD